MVNSSSTQADEVQLVFRQTHVKKDNSFSLSYQENCLGWQCSISPSIFSVSTHWMLLFTVPNDSMGLRRALFTISGVLYELVRNKQTLFQDENCINLIHTFLGVTTWLICWLCVLTMFPLLPFSLNFDKIQSNSSCVFRLINCNEQLPSRKDVSGLIYSRSRWGFHE